MAKKKKDEQKKVVDLNPSDFKDRAAYMKAYMQEYHKDYKNKVAAKRNVLAHTVLEKLGLLENKAMITKLKLELEKLEKENRKLMQKIKSILEKKVSLNYEVKIGNGKLNKDN
jgi:hypothetical protein